MKNRKNWDARERILKEIEKSWKNYQNKNWTKITELSM